MQPTKNYRDFIREFNKNDFPFRKFFTESKRLKKDLFEQFLRTEPIPCWDLYIAKFFSKKELIDGIEEARNNIPTYSSSNKIIAASFINLTLFEIRWYEIRENFAQLIADKKLKADYLSFDLDQTNIVKILKMIEIEIKDFKNFLIENPNLNDYDNQAKVFSESFISHITQLHDSSLKLNIVREILTDEDNFYILIRQINKKRAGADCDFESNYRNLRRHLKSYLREYETTLVNEITPPSPELKHIDVALRHNGFFELPTVSKLSKDGEKKLIELIINNDIVYQIALFDFLGFIAALSKKPQFRIKEKLYKHLSTFLKLATVRKIKGNILVLNKQSTENRSVYTAYRYQEKVKEDYEMLN